MQVKEVGAFFREEGRKHRAAPGRGRAVFQNGIQNFSSNL